MDFEPIITDLGSDTIKSGILGDDEPRSLLSPLSIGKGNPFENGRIKDWDILEKIFRFTFYQELRITPEEHSILMSEYPLMESGERERMTSILFESFNFPNVFLCSAGSLPLFSKGILTGLSVTSGHSLTYTCPVYEGHVLNRGIIKFDFSGKDLTEYFMKILKTNDEEKAREIKEMYSFITLDEEKKDFILPDGTKLEITKGTNLFFNNKLDKFDPKIKTVEDYGGIQDSIYTSIQNVDESLTETFYKNVILSGGSSLIKGFKDRLEQELKFISDDESWPNVTVLKDQDVYATWLGASTIASKSWFGDLTMSKLEYEEIGPQIVHRKCI